MSSPPHPILFVSSPDSGLLNPILTVTEELARREVGDLWFATDDNRREEIETIGERCGGEVRFVSLGDVVPELSSGAWDDETYRAITQPSRWKAHMALLKQTFNPTFRMEKYRLLEAAVKEIKPALMVIDCVSFFGFEVAITHKIPFVLSAPFPPSNILDKVPPGYPVPHSGLPYHMTSAQRWRNRVFKVRKAMPQFADFSLFKQFVQYVRSLDELGISRDALGYQNRVDRAEMLFCYSVEGLDYPLPLPDKMHLLGAMVPPLPEAPDDKDLSAWLADHDSVVYMGFGTVTRLSADQVGNLLDVARKLEGRHHVLWKLPASQQKFLPPADQLPGNLRVEDWVPSQVDVIAHPNVKVFVTHGGGSGFHQGLFFGKPLVMRPLWIDCYDQVVRGVDAGVGLALDDPHAIATDDVLDKLTRVLGDDSFRERAEHFGRLQKTAGGRERAADLLLEQLRRTAESAGATATATGS